MPMGPEQDLVNLVQTAVAEARWAFGLIPGDPLAQRARTDARGSRDEAYWQLVIEHAGDQFGSTRRGDSGILMDVHSALRDETLVLFITRFSRRDRVDNLLKGHS